MRINISVPDDLADRVRTLGLPVSRICQAALQSAADAGTEVITLPNSARVLIPAGLREEAKAEIRQLAAAERDRQIEEGY